ncbi:MAG: phosphotransferase [Clostridiales bacterium]|nr:phosphotransferase [Clostridiales bacterium]
MTLTKNIQTNETIIHMAKAAFPNKQVLNIKELTEGMCNVAYCITYQDGSESILKIASKDKSGNTSNEINLMKAEVEAMSLVLQHCSFKVPKVQYYDVSRTICDGDYFFMEKLWGDNFYFVKEKLSEKTISEIYEEIGKNSKELTCIQNSEFGFLGDEKRYHSLYDFVKLMLTNLISDAQKRKIDIVYDAATLINQLENDKSAFEKVQTASLVHWDLWEGNVFVKDGHISGIIDWERALWGEPFMDDRFRYHNKCEAFLKGFGKTSFSEDELKRIRWYDIILYLTMMIEVFYREYEDQGQYAWAREMLEKVF